MSVALPIILFLHFGQIHLVKWDLVRVITIMKNYVDGDSDN